MGGLRKLLAWLGVPLVCLVFLPLYLLRPFNPDNNRLLARWLAYCGRFLLGMERPLAGLENLPRDRPTVVIANHQHNDDMFVLGDLLPPRTVVVGKKALLWVPIFGQVFWLGGNVMLNRAKSTDAVAVMRDMGNAIKRQHKSVWIFPEGTRSRGRGLAPFKKGAFHAALQAGMPITMICVGHYQDERQGWLRQRAPVPVRILPPLETSGLGADALAELMANCHQQMAAAIDEMSLPASVT